jgi:cyclic pyranopterin phosphate synthase
MFDPFNRKINYLRVSVTDRCNLRCTYCMPAGGIRLLEHNRILSYEKITEVIRVAVTMGIDKVRITGGEPLVRKGIVEFVRMVSSMKGIRDLGMTTNGILLESFAKDLVEAGLPRINISLDTVDPGKYREVTRGGDVAAVIRGIRVARDAGLYPIKINCVVKHTSSEPDAEGVKEFCRNEGLEIRFIHEMDLESGCFNVVEGGSGGDCTRCNRIRLTSDGRIKPCLFSDAGYDIHDHGIENALLEAIRLKPEKGMLNLSDKFHNIGG